MKLVVSGPKDRIAVFENYDPTKPFSVPCNDVGWFVIEIWSDDDKHLYSFEPMQCGPPNVINVPDVSLTET